MEVYLKSWKITMTAMKGPRLSLMACPVIDN